MSELITPRATNFHWQLLTTVSALALFTIVGARDASAADDDTAHPTVWVELGGQLERISGQGKIFSPHFVTKFADSPAFSAGSPIVQQRLPRYSKGLEGKISFTPKDSDWVFSAALLYGRANGDRRVHQQTAGLPLPTGDLFHGNPNFDPLAVKAFSDVRTKDHESHTILDFKAGKDVGLGALGRGSSSTFSFGIRFAQFTSDKNAQLKARPEIHLYGFYPAKYYSNFVATGQSARSFHGVGPTVSWDGSAALAGNAEDGITLDWGLAASVLFGRQKADVSHNTTETQFHLLNILYPNSTAYQHHPIPTSRRRSVVVPNVGGFAGISFRHANAKVSFGYRADVFFGAMDTGWDVRHTENASFHGPFATISIGLGG
jgi:hypothetical protein